MKQSSIRRILFALAAATCTLMLAGAGFGVGWFISGREVSTSAGGDNPAPVTTISLERETTLPSSDAPGKDLPDLSRYPDSVRVDYRREVVDDELTLAQVTYKAAAEVGEVRDFYRGVFRSGNWTVADLDFSAGTWSFLVVEGNRQAYIGIGPEEGLVEVSIRLSEHHRDQRSQDTTSSEKQKKPPASSKTTEEALPSEGHSTLSTAPHNIQTPNSAPPLPANGASSPPAYDASPPSYSAVPGGGYDEDYDDYDDYEGGDYGD